MKKDEEISESESEDEEEDINHKVMLNTVLCKRSSAGYEKDDIYIQTPNQIRKVILFALD